MKIYYRNIGVVVIHGFGGGVHEVEPLSKKLKMLGYPVATPSLSGHEGTKKDFKKASYKDWIKDAEDAYLSLKEKCDEIIVIGFSMGALLSLQIAWKYKVKGVITLNAPIFIASMKMHIKRITGDLIHRNFSNLTNMFRQAFRLPLHAYIHFTKLLKATKKIIPDIKCDILVNQAYNDEVVRCKSANYLHDHVNSQNKKLMFYKKSKHLILQSEVAEDVIVDLVKYIENVS